MRALWPPLCFAPMVAAFSGFELTWPSRRAKKKAFDQANKTKIETLHWFPASRSPIWFSWAPLLLPSSKKVLKVISACERDGRPSGHSA